MLKDIGHPYSRGEPVYDIAFENVQAGERTSHLFRLANFHGGMVIGTGDLSELALGWCTYGVGDHMSHYNVNASVPKTLIKHLVRWVAAKGVLGDDGSQVLHDIVDTEVSPELVPHAQPDDKTDEGAGQPGQSTEAAIGPYELQDFHLFQTLRFGFPPAKTAFLAHVAWGDRTQGAWPEGIGAAQPVHAGRDQAPPAHLPLPLLRHQPVQALVHPERAEGGVGRIAQSRGGIGGRRAIRGMRCGWRDLERVPGGEEAPPSRA